MKATMVGFQINELARVTKSLGNISSYCDFLVLILVIDLGDVSVETTYV